MGESSLNIFLAFISIILVIFIIGIVLFVSEYRKRKLLHQQEKDKLAKKHELDLLSMQLLAQEQTMQFIGREIHDSVAQKLTLAAIYTQKLEYENQFPGLTTSLKNISNVINDSLIELRSLSKTLTDNRTHDLLLGDLLAAECQRVNETGVSRAELSYTFDGAISVTVKSFLLRILQEFIQNSLKHAGAKLIRMTVESDNGDLVLIASDDGNGFDAHNPGKKGMGLSNMERRVQLMGGSAVLTSEIGKGTRLNVRIPEKKLMTT
jgi:signal transduction histidine kinase